MLHFELAASSGRHLKNARSRFVNNFLYCICISVCMNVYIHTYVRIPMYKTITSLQRISTCNVAASDTQQCYFCRNTCVRRYVRVCRYIHICICMYAYVCVWNCAHASHFSRTYVTILHANTHLNNAQASALYTYVHTYTPRWAYA